MEEVYLVRHRHFVENLPIRGTAPGVGKPRGVPESWRRSCDSEELQLAGAADLRAVRMQLTSAAVLRCRVRE